MKLLAVFLVISSVMFLFAGVVQAQQLPSSFAEPVIRKVENKDRAAFMQRFGLVNMTGEGFQGNTIIDNLPTAEIRARLQQAFGDPTVRLDDFIGDANMRLGNTIQFEYWFIVNDEVPMMILDIDGPFTIGLVYAGSPEFIDYMPEIKRTLSRRLMGVNRLGEFSDTFYSPERNDWYVVEYKSGEYRTEKISRPTRFNSLRIN